MIVILVIGFLLGWLFPVEGPMDDVYGNYRVRKSATKLSPPQKPQCTLTEEELDYIDEMLRETFSLNKREDL